LLCFCCTVVVVDLLKQGYGPDDPVQRQKYFDLQASLPPSTYGFASRPQTQTNNVKALLTLRNSPASNSSAPFGKGTISVANGKSPGIRATSTPKKIGNLPSFNEHVMHTISPERIHANVLTLERRVESLFDKFEENAESLSISMAGLSDKMTHLDINLEEVKDITRDMRDNASVQQSLQPILPPPLPMLPPPPPPQPIVIQAPQCCSSSNFANNTDVSRHVS